MQNEFKKMQPYSYTKRDITFAYKPEEAYGYSMRVWCSTREIDFDNTLLIMANGKIAAPIDVIRAGLAHELGHCSAAGKKAQNGREAEFIADEQGYFMWKRLGYNTEIFIRIMSFVDSNDGIHPSAKERVANLRKFEKSLRGNTSNGN